MHHQDLSSLQSKKINPRYKFTRMLPNPNRIITLISMIIYQLTEISYASIALHKGYRVTLSRTKLIVPTQQKGEIGRGCELNPPIGNSAISLACERLLESRGRGKIDSRGNDDVRAAASRATDVTLTRGGRARRRSSPSSSPRPPRGRDRVPAWRAGVLPRTRYSD